MYNSFYKKYRGICEEHLTLFICIIFAFVATIVSRLSMMDFVLFVAVQFICVYIPGLAILRLNRITLEDAQIRNFVAYAIGYCMSILVYLLLLMMGLQHLSRTISIAIAVLALLLVCKQKDAAPPASLRERYFMAAIMTLCLVIGMVVFQYSNRMPIEEGNNIFVSQDLVFWFRNCVAATKSYPLPELSVMGKDFYYHYFTSVEIAWLHYMTGIEILDLCFTYSYLITLFLLSSGVYVVGRGVITNREMASWAVLFILFTSSLEIYTHIFYSPHIFSVSFGFAEGLAISCFSLYFFVRWFRSGFTSNIDVVFSVLFLMVCTGLKGPVAAVVLVGYGIGCIMAIFTNGTFGRIVATGFAYLIVFVLIMALFVLNNHESSVEGSTSELTVSLTGTMFHSHLYEKLYQDLMSAIPLCPLVYIIVFILYIFSAMLIPTILFMYAVKRCPLIKGVNLIMLSIVVCGIVLTMFVSQSGMSQMYFMLVSILYLILLSFSLLSRDSLVTVNHKFLCGVFLLGIMLFVGQLASKAIPFVRGTLNSLHVINLKQNFMEESGFTISKAEIEGLRWVRDHVSEDVVLLSNKVLEENGGARCFWVSSITERQIYFESYDYSNLSENSIKDKKELVARFYNGDKEISSFLKKEGVAYAVVFKHLHYNPELYSANKDNLVFENRDMFLLKL